MLQLKNVNKVFVINSEDQVKALKDISLSFPSRGLVFVTGKSGAGKSTLLNIIGGLDKPTSGEILIEGKSTDNFKPKDFDKYRNNYIGFIFQEYSLLEQFTIAENIGLSLKLRKKQENIAQKISDTLKDVDLEGYEHRKWSTLSGGQKQRVAIARALIKDPYIILADEPTGALDSENGSQVLDILKKISAKRLVIVVSHDEDYATKYADYKIELTDGRVTSSNLKDDYGDEVVEKREFDEHSSSLAFLEKAKIAFKYMLSRPLRLAVTLLLAATSLGIFGLADTLSTFDEAYVAAKALVQNVDKTIDIGIKGKTSSLSQYILDDLATQTGINFHGIYGSTYIALKDNVEPEKYIARGEFKYFPTFISELVTLSDINDLGYNYSLLYGRAPKSAGEIAITDYDLETYKEYALNKGIAFDPTSVLNEKLEFKPNSTYKTYYLNIVGIVNTEFEPEHFRPLLEAIHNTTDDNDFQFLENYDEILALQNELDFMSQYSFIGSGFLSSEDLVYFENIYSNCKLDTGIGPFSFSDNSSLLNPFLSKYIADFDRMDLDLNTYFDDVPLFDSDAVIVPIDQYIEVLYRIKEPQNEKIEITIPQKYNYPYVKDAKIVTTMKEFFDIGETNYIRKPFNETYAKDFVARKKYKDAFANEKIDLSSFVEKYFSEKETDVPELISEEDKLAIFQLYLDGLRLSKFNDESGYSKDIINDVLATEKDFIEEFIKSNASIFSRRSLYLNYQEDYKSEVKTKKFNIIGFSFDREYYDMAISHENARKFSTQFETLYRRATFSKNENFDDIVKLVRLAMEQKENNDGKYIYIDNPLINDLYPISENIKMLQFNFAIATAVLAAVSFLLLFNYISASIFDKHREIGILRSLGAKKTDVLSIFLFESLIICLIAAILSIVLLAIAVFCFNFSLANPLGFTLTLFHMSIRQIGFILLLAIAVAVISAAIPIYKITRSEVITEINRRK